MNKRILIAVLALVLCFSGTVNAAAEEAQNPGIEINGKMLEASAVISGGELFLPLRAVSAELGFDLQWLGNEKGIELNLPDKSVFINLSEYKLVVNEHETYLSGEYRLINSSTYMRRDFFSDVLRLEAVWDKASNKVSLKNTVENAITINTIKKSSETDNLKLTLQYPELKGLENTEVENKLNAMFAKLAEEAGNRGHSTAGYMAAEQLARGIKAEVYFGYKVKYNQKGFLSIVFLDYIYSGGAHGLTVQSSYNLDLETGTEYKLKDVFKAGTDYVSNISGEVKKQMEERGIAGYVIPFEAIRADQDFYLSNNELVVYFQAYEYTPYAAGIPEFALDLPTIMEAVSPEFEFLYSVPVRFEKVNVEQQVKPEEKMQIGAVLLNAEVASGRAYVYEKAADKENLHGGFAAGESFYDLGAIGSIQGGSNEFTSVRVLELYGNTVVKFQGAFGSHVSNTSYFVIDQGVPVPLLSTEGYTTEMDIDGDGTKEIVVQLPGTIPSVNIYERAGASFLTAGVDASLNAGSVTFNREDGSFSAYYKEQGSEITLVKDYYYNNGAMKLKKAPGDTGDILSENTVDYNKDSIYEKLILKMSNGKQYEETAPGPFQGWNWEGEFILQLVDDKGAAISEYKLNEAFENEKLIFNRVFLIQFDDYNNDGNTDFAIGQYGSSNGSIYRLFTIRAGEIQLLPLQTGSIFSSAGNSRYTIGFEKFPGKGFLNSYYDNTVGKNIEQGFVWDGSQFVLKSTIEK